MQLESAIYRVIYKRKNITVSFVEHREISKINRFYTYTSGEQKQIKVKQLELGQCTFWKCYIQGAPQKKQYHCSFLETPKISRKYDFYTFTLGE